MSPEGHKALSPSQDYGGSPTTSISYTPSRLPVKKTPVSLWDLMALQDVYSSKNEQEAE